MDFKENYGFQYGKKFEDNSLSAGWFYSPYSYLFSTIVRFFVGNNQDSNLCRRIMTYSANRISETFA